MATYAQLLELADAVEALAGHFTSVSDRLNEQAGHVASLIQEVRDTHDQHAAAYDDPSATGDETRAKLGEVEHGTGEVYSMLASADDSLKDRGALLFQVASDIRDHAGRIAAALGG